MKNKFLILLAISFSLVINISFADPFVFKTKEIEIKNDGNLIYAKEGRAISADNNLEIEAKNFEYDQNLDVLKAFNGIAYIKSDNLEIKFNEIELNQKNSNFIAKNNVKIFEVKKKLFIETNLVTYDLKLKILESSTKSILKDQFNNFFDTQYFNYNINKNILKLRETSFKDSEQNNYYLNLAYVNTQSNKLFGKDVDINLNNKSFNKNNEPRLKGKSVVSDNETTVVSKGVFTTCKKTDKCPPWQLSAEEIRHDKKKQVVNYKNAWLQVYDVPVMYFPKFFHPDPTVKRRSGFLIPTFKNSSNSSNYLSVPYFHAISLNKDITFTPRFFAEDKILLQTEYRQVNLDSSHISDLSIFKEKDLNSKNHFFYSYDKIMNFSYFEDASLNLNIEKTSNDTYLKLSKLDSPLITTYDVMENSLSFDLYSDDFSIDTDLIVYENLNKNNNSDKYEFILPSINLIKNIENETNLNGNFSFTSNNLARNYDTNVFEKTNINNLIFNSNPKISNNGFYNNYDFIIKNVNSDSNNSDSFKENENYYLSSLFQFNSSLPLIKENENYQNILKPKMAIKISPGHTKNISKDEIRLDASNIYSLDRLSSNDTLESGVSLAYGNDFKIFDKTNSRDLFSFKLANNLRLKDNEDLPTINQLDEKTSNFFSEIDYNPNNFINVKYNTSRKSNIKDTTYENLVTQISVNNLVTTFDYINENNTLDKNSYLLNTTKYELNDTNNVVFSTRENKTLDLTEYYNLMYQYKNDCLAASVEYDKTYYDDRDVKPEENIFLKLTIIPFGETSSPNLKN
jgi:LPS-assembly protein